MFRVQYLSGGGRLRQWLRVIKLTSSLEEDTRRRDWIDRIIVYQKFFDWHWQIFGTVILCIQPSGQHLRVLYYIRAITMQKTLTHRQCCTHANDLDRLLKTQQFTSH